MLSEAFKLITVPWAHAVPENRVDPEDASLTPQLSLPVGWDDDFSDADAPEQPRRRVFNELRYRRDSALLDIRRYGVLPWDAEVDTLAGGVKQVAGVLYRALVDNGPTYRNAISPTADGQTVWVVVPGHQTLPAAPDAPVGTTPRSGEIDWTWNCPRDGGAAITSFDFQWRAAGTTAWSASITVTVPRAVINGLPNGRGVEARVRARTSVGVSLWSGTGSATPSGTTPGGGAELALRASPGDRQISLSWLTPDSGGVPITSYTLQWRTDQQSFTASRQRTIGTTQAVVSPLANGTEVFFRVQAINSEGAGAWSNEASATPEAPPPPPPGPPPDTVPGKVPEAPTGSLLDGDVLWQWPLPGDGGRRIIRFDVQVRDMGDPWPSTDIERVSSCLRQADPSTGTHEARARAVNEIGPGAWSDTGSVTVT